VWKSREALEKSTFFKRLKIQGVGELSGLWDELQSSELRTTRVLRLNPLRQAKISDFKTENFVIGDELINYSEIYRFDLTANAKRSQHPLWGAGLAFVQDASALEIVDALGVQPGEWVLDLCAAPGGKSTRIAEILGNHGWLVSNDSDLKRARILSNNLIRHGAIRSTVFAKNGAQVAAYFPESFDKILLDAPCSGESLFFKREDRRRDVYESEVQECAQLQHELLQAAGGAIKPGGRIVYSTCTYNVTENEEIVRRFLKNNSQFELRKEVRRWPHEESHGFKAAGGYFAVIERRGTLSENHSQMLRHAEAERHAVYDKDGKINLYAQVMLPSGFELPKEEGLFAPPGENFEDWILMTQEEAKAYLEGEAIPNPARKQGLHRILWREKFALGPAKGVESRFNNLLPLETRAQFRNL
jgi:16S rRNA C967 or C1407 C5-methylase (RsmB/RsmF family)/NOL1/NOP2/fmu family ribosome biogenesis protein